MIFIISNCCDAWHIGWKICLQMEMKMIHFHSALHLLKYCNFPNMGNWKIDHFMIKNTLPKGWSPLLTTAWCKSPRWGATRVQQDTRCECTNECTNPPNLFLYFSLIGIPHHVGWDCAFIFNIVMPNVLL